MKQKRNEKMLNVHEVAEKLGASESSVRVWAWRGRFPGARKEVTPLGEYWLIPESALDGFELGKPGPKPGAKKSGRKKDKRDT
jgi:hypothetical protein